MRNAVSLLLCVAAVGVGVATAVRSAKNRALGADLDRRTHWCDTLERQNQLRRARVGRDEWSLLHGEDRASSADPTHSNDETRDSARTANIDQ